jgi:hypothetical protein
MWIERGVAVLGAQGFRRGFGGREVHVRDAGDDAAVHLLGPRVVDVAAAQSGLDMADRNLAVISGEARDHRGQCVAMHDHAVRLLGVQRRADAGDEPRGERIEALVLLHHVEVDVRHDPGDLQHLIEQAAMLRGDADAGLQALAARAGRAPPGTA